MSEIPISAQELELNGVGGVWGDMEDWDTGKKLIHNTLIFPHVHYAPLPLPILRLFLLFSLEFFLLIVISQTEMDTERGCSQLSGSH